MKRSQPPGRPKLPKRIIMEDPTMNLTEIESELEESDGDGGPSLLDNFGKKFYDDSLSSAGQNGLMSLSSEEPEGSLQCHSCDPPCDPENEYICQNALACFKSQYRDSVGSVRLSRGCVQKQVQVSLTCSVKKHRKSSAEAQNKTLPDYSHTGTYAVDCCYTDLCNEGDFPELPSPKETEHHAPFVHEPVLSGTNLAYIIAAGSFIIFALVLTGIFILVARKKHRKRMNELINPKPLEFDTLNFLPDESSQLQAKPAGDSTLKEFMDGSLTSGSGSGLPLLIQRTLAKNIQLKKCIGKGRYGEVWQGVWNCENVAVKIFSTRDEASWARETEIYSTVMLRHENILGFYGSDMISRNSVTQLWLVTHFHRNGSLYDYMNENTLSNVQLLKFAYSIANGLAFLHSEMVGTESRAGIAHRDIKSKNILVTSGEYCVIADFGLAVTHKRDTGEINVGTNPKVGTRRYMAPEILNETINERVFDSYKRADIYSFGLVLWEMCRRTEPEAEEFQLPYYDIVPSDPSFDDMKKIVSDNEYRPELPERYANDPVLAFFGKRLIKECWHQNPPVRPSALRIKKSIAVLAQEKFKGVLETVHV